MAARIHGRKNTAGDAMKAAIEFLFKSTEAIVVHPDIAEDLSGKLIIGVEALKLLLEIDALHVKGAQAVCHFRSHAPGDPGEAVSVVESISDLVFGGPLVFKIDVNDAGKEVRGGFLVVDLGGHGVDGVDLYGGGEFAQIAIVQNAATRSYFKCALLLLFSALDILVMMNNLEPEEPARDSQSSEEEKQAHKPKARQLEGRGARSGVSVSVGSKGGLHGRI